MPAGSAAPFQGAFGADLTGGQGSWNGTLFRLPLRTPEQAAESSISRQSYDSDKVARMLDALRSEAPLVLLFLKSVRRIDVLDWADSEAAPTPLFSCEAVPADWEGGGDSGSAAAAAAAAPGGAPAHGGREWATLLEHRALFLRAAEAPEDADVASAYSVALVTRCARAGSGGKVVSV
jgi:hypothetical protein